MVVEPSLACNHRVRMPLFKSSTKVSQPRRDPKTHRFISSIEGMRDVRHKLPTHKFICFIDTHILLPVGGRKGDQKQTNNSMHSTSPIGVRRGFHHELHGNKSIRPFNRQQFSLARKRQLSSAAYAHEYSSHGQSFQ